MRRNQTKIIKISDFIRKIFLTWFCCPGSSLKTCSDPAAAMMMLSVRLSPQICWFSPSSHNAQKPHQICWLSHRCGPAAQGGRGQPVTTLRSLRHFSFLTLLLSTLPDHSLSITVADIYTLSHSQCSPHSHLDGRIYLTAEVITGECYKGRAQGPTDWLSRGQVSPGCTGLYWAVLHCTVLAGRDSLLEPGDNWDHLALSQLQILIPYIFSLKV